MQCVCSDQLNIQLKAVLCIKHLAAEDITFQQYMQSCGGALKILDDIAAPPIVPQARSLEPQEVRTVRDATKSAITAIHTPHTVEKATEHADLKQRIQGFGNFEPPLEEQPTKTAGVAGQVADFVADSVGDMVDDFREKGAVGALKDATIDALDLVLDGVDAVWGWVAGRKDGDGPRICQPSNPALGGPGVFNPSAASYSAGGAFPGGPGGFPPPPVAASTSASNHYAAAFGGGVVGANNPVMLGGLPPAAPAFAGHGIAAAAPAVKEPPPPEKKEPPPAPMVDLLSMDEPAPAAKPAAVPEMGDLLGDISSAPPPQTTQNMLDF